MVRSFIHLLPFFYQHCIVLSYGLMAKAQIDIIANNVREGIPKFTCLHKKTSNITEDITLRR